MASPNLSDHAPRVLSGITPSGSLTLGNYLGALKRFVDGQERQRGELRETAWRHAEKSMQVPAIRGGGGGGW